MGTYKQIGYGSSGDEVKKLQETLNQNGYKLTVDGVFGKNTLDAVRQYQQSKGLAVDGIVGNNTWGSLLGNGNTVGNGNAEVKNKDYGTFSYKDYKESDTVKDAANKLGSLKAPEAYQSKWDDQIQATIDKILNREKFSYDLNGDALYQQYADKAQQQGKMAMMDTMGQAAAMTGGYGSSYASTAGNQAYQAHLSELNDIIPELQQLAYEKYRNEGQDLVDQYSLLAAQEEQDYGRHRDEVSDYNAERDYLAGRYDAERSYDYGKYADDRSFAYGKFSDDRNLAYAQDRDKVADEQWQKEFGMALEKWNLEKSQYEGSNNGGSVSDIEGVVSDGDNSGWHPSAGSFDNGSLSTSQIKALQKALGVEADGMYGSGSKSAAGGLSAEEAYKKYVGNNEGYTAVNTKGVSNFKAGIMTKHEFAQRGDKSKYKNYTGYIEGKLDEWMQSGKLTEDEVATLIVYYGLN